MISIFCSLLVPRSLAETLKMRLAHVERDLDLGVPCRRRRDAGEVEFAQRLVVGGHVALALKHVDLDQGWLPSAAVYMSGLPGRDRRVAFDELREPAALGLDPQRERCDVEQQDILDVAAEHAGLIAAPIATTSSGLTPRCGSPPASFRTISTTIGIRVKPPTRTTSSPLNAGVL